MSMPWTSKPFYVDRNIRDHKYSCLRTGVHCQPISMHFLFAREKVRGLQQRKPGRGLQESVTDNKELKHHRFLMSKRQPEVNSSYSCCSVYLFGDDSRKLTALIPAVQYTFLVSTVQFKMLKRRTYSRCINVKARQSQFYSPSGCRPLLKNVSA